MYFKILSNDLTHNGYTYHEGLNVDPVPFDPRPTRTGGMFFADEKIFYFFVTGEIKLLLLRFQKEKPLSQFRISLRHISLYLGKSGICGR